MVYRLKKFGPNNYTFNDIEYKYPWGFDELEGVASRTDYDLKKHAL